VPGSDGQTIERIGVVVHPIRDVERPLDALRAWAGERGVQVRQLAVGGDAPEVAPAGTADEMSVVVAIGGDGTVLAALRAASPVHRPVLGVACGSLGALTTVAGSQLVASLDAFAAGDWSAHAIPALAIADGGGRTTTAINDLVVVRDGGNQVSVEIEVDGVLYARFAGDGVLASTQIGSSAYTLAVGGPLLAPGSDGWLVAPLANHGGFIPPIVLGASCAARLLTEPGYAGARVEIDGQRADLDPRELSLERRSNFGTIVRVRDEEPFLSGLRRRGIVTDSPRMLAREARLARARVR
jgi:NAD+ kinase